MDEDLSILQASVTRFMERELLPLAEGWEKAGIVDRDHWRLAGKGGLLCISIPEAYGGGGGTLAHEAVVLEAFTRTGTSGLGSGVAVSCSIVAHYILAYGSEQQKQRWLPPMASGDLVAAVAMTEPGTGSDLQSVRTSATKVQGGYVLNGAKTFISNGQNAELVLVVAKTDPEARGAGLSLLAVETVGAEGFRRGRNLDKVGMHAQDTSELFFDDVFVPDENLLGPEPGQGFAQLTSQLGWERLSIAIGCVANMERALDLTRAYVKQREAFGKPLLSFQNTQFKLAECEAKARIGRVYVDEMMVRLVAGRLDPVDAAVAKYWCSDTLGEVLDECLQLHGGYGYMAEYAIARMWADARVTRIFGGTNEIMKLIISRTL
jgi:acyl-CoA dehydrogenase